jgi:hypothetical protein
LSASFQAQEAQTKKGAHKCSVDVRDLCLESQSGDEVRSIVFPGSLVLGAKISSLVHLPEGLGMDLKWSKLWGFADCRKEPAKWNQQWEHQLKQIASVNILQKSTLSDDTEDILTHHRTRLRELCIFQNNLTVLAADFAQDNFESKWVKSSTAHREKHLLEGIVRTSTELLGMEGYRIFCDEITLPFLEKDEGRGYLRLLKHFMVEDPTSLSKAPIYISNPRWDQLLPNNGGNKPSEKELALKAYYDGIRNTFICVP